MLYKRLILRAAEYFLEIVFFSFLWSHQYFSLDEPWTWPLYNTQKLPSGLFPHVSYLRYLLPCDKSITALSKKMAGKGSISCGKITPGRVLWLYDGTREPKRSHESS